MNCLLEFRAFRAYRVHGQMFCHQAWSLAGTSHARVVATLLALRSSFNASVFLMLGIKAIAFRKAAL